jgi:hypothetical protein
VSAAQTKGAAIQDPDRLPGTTTPESSAGLEQATCYRHPSRETNVSCSDCGRPICTDCMVYSAVGIKCPECAKLPRSAIVTLKPNRAARAVLAAFLGGLVMAFGVVLLQSALGLFFALLMGWLIGIAMSEIVLWASGRYRAPVTGWIAIGGCVWTYAATYLLFYGVDVGDVARSGNGVWVALGIAIAGYTAYQRTQ